MSIQPLLQKIGLSAGPTTLSQSELIDICNRDVFRYAYRRLISRQDAEDVAADVLLAALKALKRGQTLDQPKVWLLSVARRKVADELRQRMRPIEELTTSFADPASFAISSQDLDRIRKLIETLPSLQREALLLQVLDELSIAEIAQVLGKSSSAVNSLLGRARETLKSKLPEFIEGAHEPIN